MNKHSETKEILLNWLPPSMETSASPALSALKAFLENKGYQVHVKYWNLEFTPILKGFLNFDSAIYENDGYKMLPFYSYLAVKHQDIELQERIKYYLFNKKPQIHAKGEKFISKYLEDNCQIIDRFIDNEIKELDIKRFIYIGFSTQFYQWIIANIIVAKIKNIHPKAVFVAGGLGTKQEALAFVRNFDNYNYATWGEGEYSLLALTKHLAEGTVAIDSIPNIVYKDKNALVATLTRSQFANLEEIDYNYSDYFSSLVDLDIKRISIPIEGGRGCHWKKCKFCFLNSGYKYRTKSPEKIIYEIRNAVETYKISNISFLDNDIIGNDLIRFEHLLDLLIKFRSECSTFKIFLAEVITKNLNARILKKMSLAGFKQIQIGYESPSDNLLKKINKKNTFASNLLVIKWGNYLGFRISGANVLRGLLEESEEDIKEAIYNLYYMRFFLKKETLKHDISTLAIAESSTYYKELSSAELKNYESLIFSFLPKNYILEEDKHKLLFDFVNTKYNKLWNTFENVESFYLNNKYDYQILKKEGSVYYRESYNQIELKELEFDTDNSIHWDILEACNQEVQSVKKLELLLDLTKMSKNETLENVIKSLNSEGILYYNNDMTEVVTIINTDLASVI